MYIIQNKKRARCERPGKNDSFANYNSAKDFIIYVIGNDLEETLNNATFCVPTSGSSLEKKDLFQLCGI